MKKTIKLTESDLEGLVEKILKESSLKENRSRGGMTFGPFSELVDMVTDGYRSHREKYKEAFERFNEDWPLDEKKVKTLPLGLDSSFNPFRYLVDAVTDRYRLYREDYKEAFERFNEDWGSDERRFRTIPPGGGR